MQHKYTVERLVVLDPPLQSHLRIFRKPHKPERIIGKVVSTQSHWAGSGPPLSVIHAFRVLLPNSGVSSQNRALGLPVHRMQVPDAVESEP